ncbi:hypothetical protein V8C35DRAFT_215795 [Trichoderma chlorosporum]
MPDPKGLAKRVSSEGGSRLLDWRFTLVWSLLLGQSLGGRWLQVSGLPSQVRSGQVRSGRVGLMRGLFSRANKDNDKCQKGTRMQADEEKEKGGGKRGSGSSTMGKYKFWGRLVEREACINHGSATPGYEDKSPVDSKHPSTTAESRRIDDCC